MRALIVCLGLTLSSCSFSGPPQYMTDAVRGEEDAKRALDRIRYELGTGFDARVVEEVFFVAANGGPRALEVAEATVKRMSTELYRHFFTRRPARPIRVYCFRDRTSYDAYVRSAYGRAPTTPYGFYMASERKMVLNLGTGTGTLAHEIVHPLLCEDFPGVPAWFNEGFASLFEFTKVDGEGRLMGERNWRINDLKRATREGHTISLRTLMETNTDEFYGDDRGVNYAMARYFCIYLQRQDLLARFYKEFRASADTDSTGIASLERVTRMSFADFETEWQSWIFKEPPR